MLFGQYGLTEVIKNAFALLLTKIQYPGARLIRRPLYLRGGKHLMQYGPGFTTGYSCRIEMKGEDTVLFIGRNCKINDRVHISAHERIEIGNNVLMGSNILITDNCHGSYSGLSQDNPATVPDMRKVTTKPVKICDNVWIGEFVSILPGVTIGPGAIVGSGSVVTRSVSAETMVAGNPARAIKRWDAEKSRWVRIDD